MSHILGVVGTGGFAREVMPLAVEALESGKFSDVFFVETEPRVSELNGFSVLSESEFLDMKLAKSFCVAIADAKTREKIHQRFVQRDAQHTSLISKDSIQYHNVKVAAGSILCAFTTITSNAEVGEHFQANIYSYVAHDCVIGDYVTFAPRVHCNGNVIIKDYAYIGTGAIIKQGTPERPIVIGEGAIVGMGAVVTKSVPDGVTVVGNPAKDIKDRSRLRSNK